MIALTSTSASEPFLRRHFWWLVLDPPEPDPCLTDCGTNMHCDARLFSHVPRTVEFSKHPFPGMSYRAQRYNLYLEGS